MERPIRDGYQFSRHLQDDSETNLLRDVAFNRHSMQDGKHISPFWNGDVNIGTDGIVVKLVNGLPEEAFKQVMSYATRATIGIDMFGDDYDNRDWEEMLRGGLQTSLEDFVVVFAVQGVSRTCTHQLVRSRRAAFHQQSQRASFYGEKPETRMPESVWRNLRAREAFIAAIEASHDAYKIACDEDISYQDARYALLEGTDNFILCEYPLREFLAVYAYRACSMFSWEIVYAVREMGRLLGEAHPWLKPYIKISCQDRPCEECGGRGTYTTEWSDKVNKLAGFRAMVIEQGDGVATVRCHVCMGTGLMGSKCTFQGWESVEGQCPFDWAKESLRTFQPKHHAIRRANGGVIEDHAYEGENTANGKCTVCGGDNINHVLVKDTSGEA